MSSVTLPYMTNSFFYPVSNQSAAISSEIGAFDKDISEAMNYHYEYTASGYKRESINELADLLNKGQEDISSSDVNLDSFIMAMRFIEMLPAHFMPPEVYLTDDGNINFDWEKGPSWSLTIIFNEDSTITFAGLFGEKERCHGIRIIKESIPSDISAIIERTNYRGD